MKAESEHIEISFFPKSNPESEQFGINFSGGGAPLLTRCRCRPRKP